MAATYLQRLLGIVRDNERAMVDIFQRPIDVGQRAIMRRTNADGVVPRSELLPLQREIGESIHNVFIGTVPQTGQRAPFTFVGGRIMPLSPYMSALWTTIEQVTRLAVEQHASIIRRYVSPETVAMANAISSTTVFEFDDGSSIEIDGYSTFKLNVSEFRQNPFANYEPAHTWVDPNGYRLSDRIWNTDAVTRRRIDAFLADGIRQGKSSLNMSRELEAFLKPGRTLRTKRPYGTTASFDAMRLARTEISRAHARASEILALSNEFVSGVNVVLSRSHPKYDICDVAAAASPFPKDAIPDQYRIPLHPHCILPNNQVQLPGSLLAGAKSFYDGPCVEIRTVRGCRLTVTPNHPILTQGGWRDAHLLRAGDDVFVATDSQWMKPSVNPDDQDMPVTIQECFDSIEMACEMPSVRMPVSPKDFHGDARFMHGDVNIVNVDGLLLRDGEAVMPETIGQLGFNGNDASHATLSGLGIAQFGLPTHGVPTLGNMGGEHVSASFVESHAIDPGTIPLPGGIQSSWNDIGREQSLAESSTIDPSFASKFLFRFAGQIALDKIVEIRYFDYSGHVYDLQVSPYELYIASGIVVKNCLCHYTYELVDNPDEIVERAEADIRRNRRRIQDHFAPLLAEAFIERLLAGDVALTQRLFGIEGV